MTAILAAPVAVEDLTGREAAYGGAKQEKKQIASSLLVVASLRQSSAGSYRFRCTRPKKLAI